MTKHVKYILTYALLASPLPATAQTSPIQSNLGFEHIVVTAQKRTENLQDVAISLEVLQGDSLEDFHINDLRSVTTLVPNFYFQPSPGNDALYIRGFGSAGANFGFEQSVSLYQDGIYAGRARQFMAPFFDIERVEVLRGPQGALLGKNTAAGAVSIVTANPTKEFEGSVTSIYNFTRDGTDIKGYVSGPLSETLGARLAVMHSNYGGYIRNTAADKKDPSYENTLARLSLRFEPSEKADFTGKIEYGHFKTRGDPAASSPLNAPLPKTKSDKNIFGFPLIDRQEAWNASLTSNFYIADHTLTAVTGYADLSSYRAVDAAHEAPAVFHNQYYEDFDQFSQEIRLLSPVEKTFEYIVGGYYDISHWDLLAPTYYNIAALSANGHIDIDFRQKTETLSGFFAGTFNVLDSFRVKGSLRYTHSKKNGIFDESLVSGTTHPAVGTPRAFSKKLSEEYWDPSLTLEYDASDDVMLFANYARGSKGAGYVAAVRTTLPSTFTVLGERSTNYELGIKSTWFERRLTLNLTAYNTEFDNLQVSAYNVAAATTITTNAARARSRGLEGTAILALTQDLRMSTSFAYLDSEYLDYPGAPCTAQQPAPCTAATNNLKGYPLLSTPKWSGNLRLEYATALTDQLKLETNFVTTFKSKYYVATDYSRLYGIQKTWAKIDGRIQISNSNDNWTLALVGTNLTNKRTVPFAYAFPAIFSTTGTHLVRYIDEPRTLSVEASLDF